MASRRAFLAGLLATALPQRSWADAGSPAYLAAGERGGAFALHGLSTAGDSLFSLPLPARGHAAAAHPARPEAVAFARRPGTFAVVLDCATGRVRHRLAPPEGRQFNGHGAFSSDGALLHTSEVVAESSEGRIGLWETSGYTRIGEWPSGGIGPHDLKVLPGGGLVVANGGIQTDPTDRRKLNLGTMRPNLTLLDAAGAIADQAGLPPDLRANSIRHLALAPDGRIAFAMQWEGDSAEAVPPLGLWAPGLSPVLCEVPEADAFTLQGYAGSVAADAQGGIAITSPRGGAVMLFDAAGRHRATHRRADICGIAPRGGGFLASDGLGALWACDGSGLALLHSHGIAWDNHIVPV